MDNHYYKKNGSGIRLGNYGQNFETIKLQPATLNRLRNCCHNDKQRPDNITFDELLNRLIDRVEALDDRESDFIQSLRNFDLT